MRKPTITLVSGFIPFVFVVPPTDFAVSGAQNHKPIEIVDSGEVVRNGQRQCLRVSFSGFFPNINSSFYSLLNPMPPKACEDFLRDKMNKNTVFKLFIPEWIQFVRVKIENLDIIYTDHTGDIYYNISLVEERADISTTVDVVKSFFG